MVTVGELRDAQLGSLDTAADAWITFGKRAEDLSGDTSAELIGPLRASPWAGPAADAAFHLLDKVDDEFEVAAMQVRTIGALLSGAADELRGLQRQLQALIGEAAGQGFTVGDDGRVTPPQQTYAEIHDPDSALVMQQRMNVARDLAHRVADILTRATDADRRCSRALDELITEVFGQEPYEYGDASDDARAAADALGLTEATIPAAGTDPRQVNAWWKTLTPEQQQLYLTAYPARFGALDGMPSGDRDYANRLALRDYIGDNVNNYRDHRNDQHDRALMLLDKLERSEQGPDTTRLYLLTIDPVGDGKAAVAIGNPDTADHTAVLVPGVGNKLDDIGLLIDRSGRIQSDALQMAPGSTVSVVGWLGYDTPSLDEDIVTATAGGKSRAGAAALDGFVNGLHATHQAGVSDHITAIGHSYGSTVLGEAASHGDGLAVTDMVAVGSPGMRVAGAEYFNVPTDHVWAGAAADDNFVARPENTARKIPLIGDWIGETANEHVHGPGPHYPQFGGNVLSIDTQGHSGYWDNDSLSLHNQAAVVTGAYNRVIITSGKVPPS
ncbi:alpha/beta hydrolase [Actinoplanes sp. NPDC049118]|uniref:alpha/beta hydrolase n=1 Tax=Actinoplanes sp. NPDC049118 TaxID=3155769 RepID=UPI0033E2B8D6